MAKFSFLPPFALYQHPLRNKMTSIALNPLLTGPALALFTMYGDRATELLRRYPVLANLPTAKILKWLLALGLIRSANRWMNSLASELGCVQLASNVPDLHLVNNWVAKADTARWNWPKEIAVVTGGANGIGLCKFAFSSKISLISSRLLQW